jgi:hypothetical protein
MEVHGANKTKELASGSSVLSAKHRIAKMEEENQYLVETGR